MYVSILVLILCADIYHGLTIPAKKLIKAIPVKVSPPIWSNKYYATGTLRLPYAEIVEPFAAYYDGVKGRSRVDFYGGMDITIQRGDQGAFGQHYLIAPMTTETKKNFHSCFEVNGTKAAKISAQTVLPNPANFSFTGQSVYQGKNVNKWTYVRTIGSKTNRYILLVELDSNNPVYYEMLGYDSLLGSHFDEYKVDYHVFATTYPDDVFDKPLQGMTCTGFPGPGSEAQVLANPMQEYIHPIKDHHVHKMFDDFTKKYDKRSVNNNPDEFHHRRNIFKHNLRTCNLVLRWNGTVSGADQAIATAIQRYGNKCDERIVCSTIWYIHSMNRKGLPYKLKINHLADQTKEEIRKLRGRKTTVGKYNGGLPFKPKLNMKEVPDTLDWRLYGAVTPVKDQAVCGSCWSFGSTGAIEGALFLKTGKQVRLSQQNLIDCSWGFGNNGCDGGEEFRSYQWVMKHGGIATEYSYGQYLGSDGYCHTKDAVIGATIKSYVNVTSGDLNALRQAIAAQGPVAVGIDASHPSFAFYSHGVYYEPKCGNTPDKLDHAVLAVGYGTMDGQKYWLIKNSWSTHWGNDGYVLMSQKDNNCGVATDATFVQM